MPNPRSAILIFGVSPLILTAGGHWNLIADDEGVRLYTREVKGDSTSEFKGVCVVERPIETVGAILSDIASYPKWFFKCLQSHKIPTENSSELNFLLYVTIDTPWPFSDREAIYRVVTTIDRASGKVVVRSTALKAPRVARRKQYVRITESEFQWMLERLSANRTRITFTNRTNAAGPFADYISNPGARDTTLQSLKNLKKLLNAKSFTQRNQQNRARRFFKNRHANIIDPPETHFFRELMTA